MSSKRPDPMHLGVFFKNTGHHLAAWRHPDAQPDAGINLRHYVECVQTAERAGLDFIFFADSLAIRNIDVETLSHSSQYTAYFEPTTLLAALAMATTRIGLVSTATTSYNEPYHVARRFASLDHISAGRAGWNVVTSGNLNEAMNFGREEHYEHDERYRRATEFVEVVKGLWDSWDDDAFLYDREAGRFFDPAKVHTLDHRGDWFRVQGPLNVPRPPQGYPVIFQAGHSNVGRELAAATAEGVFTGHLLPERSAEHYLDLKQRMARYGRAPDEIRILPGLTVVCAPTAAEAREKDAYLASLVHPVVVKADISSITGRDLSDCCVDDRLPDRPVGLVRAAMSAGVIALARDENLSIRQLYERLAGSHGKLTLVGSVSEVADTMRNWFEGDACDGFILQPTHMPGNLDDVCALLVPELQNRGLVRVGYDGETLRDHMGLRRPASRHAAARRARETT